MRSNLNPISPSLACALVAAAALHAGLWWASPRAGVSGQGGGVTLVPAERAMRGEHHLAQMVVRTEARPLAAGTSTERSEEAASATTPVADIDRPVAAPRAEPEGGAAWLSTQYLEGNQLDRSPQPVHGWWLDEATLLAAGRTHLTLKLWVSASGVVDRVEVVRAEPPGDWVVGALRSLPMTPMAPGMKEGRPVAATIVVELQTENEQLR